jgi:hypothetical protein
MSPADNDVDTCGNISFDCRLTQVEEVDETICVVLRLMDDPAENVVNLAKKRFKMTCTNWYEPLLRYVAFERLII